MNKVDMEGWKSQLRKGAAELAVLTVLSSGERYGLDLLERLRAEGGLGLSEGSIYPLLNRLQRDGKIAGRWVEDEGATHPRKYYAVTEEGRALLGAMLSEWEAFLESMSHIIGESTPHE